MVQVRGRKFRDLNTLNTVIHTVTFAIIEQEIEPYLKEKLQDFIYEKVYSTYLPQAYVRRYDRGGLGDKKLMESQTIQNSVTKGFIQRVITQTVLTNPYNNSEGKELLAPLIQEEAGFAGDPSTGKPPRPYLIFLEEYINNHPRKFKQILREGYAKRGIKTKVW